MAKALVGTVVERVHKLKDQIARGGDEAQEIRHLPAWLARTMIDEGLYRFALPLELGGENADCRETIEVLEAIAAMDASVGWNVMIGSEINAIAAGGMDPAMAKEVYVDNPDVIMCGGGGPGTQPSRALKDGKGWRVFAQNTFQSGCHNATWCFQAAPLFDGEQPILDDKGNQIVKSFMVHKDQFEIVDTWNMAGLRGSGSHDVRTNGGFVDEKWYPAQLFTLPALYENPVYRIPVSTRLSYNKSAVATGVARGAIDAFIALAQEKTPFMASSVLRDRPMAQYRLGEAEATLQAARAFVFDAMKKVEENLGPLASGKQEPDWDAIKVARLACTHSAQSSYRVTDSLHNAAGTSALRMDNPLERKLRDSHGAASHRWVGPQLYEELGKVYLGHERPIALA